jgi:alkylation response protein AidB-like acyl-CoA dehydrogenase
MSTAWDEPFGLDEEHREFRQFVREFARDVVTDIADEVDRTDEIPGEVVRAFADAGLTQLVVPEEWGGSGVDVRAVCIAKEEVARAGSSALALLCGQNTTLTMPLLKFGTDEQRESLLPELGKGAIVSLCLTEPDAGSHPTEMRTRAVRDGDDWILNGQKALITWGEMARYAIVFAKTEVDGADVISGFIVETAADGYNVLRHNKKMGQHGVPNVDIAIDNIRVPGTRMLGPIGQGLQTGLAMLHVNRPTMGAIAIGCAQGALDRAVRFLDERKQSGKSLTSHQGLRWAIADMATDLAAARTLLYECARLIDEGTPLAELGTLASMVKLKATETAAKVTNQALQLFGGAGYLSEHPMERYVRDARVGTLYEGTSEIQRNTIARGVLRTYGAESSTRA